MSSFFVRGVLGWGVALWVFGYVLGFVFYAFVPPEQMGWFIMPLGIAATLYVLHRYVNMHSMRDALTVGCGWTAIAIIGDYIGIVQLLAPADGYYKLDVYLYYVLTFALPVLWYVAKKGAAK